MTDVMGTCGRSCESVSGVDTIGVYEFDTQSQTVVATHVMKDGVGGDHYLSPDGRKLGVLARHLLAVFAFMISTNHWLLNFS